MLNATRVLLSFTTDFQVTDLSSGIAPRQNGVLVSMVPGRAIPYTLFALQERAELFVAPGTMFTKE